MVKRLFNSIKKEYSDVLLSKEVAFESRNLKRKSVYWKIEEAEGINRHFRNSIIVIRGKLKILK